MASRDEITWVHLSDLHFCSGWNQDRQDVLRALTKDVEKIAKPIDFAILTGDVGRTGIGDDYAAVRRWFEEDFFASTGLDWPRVHVVPGNHDVDRRIANAAIYSKILAADSSEEFDVALRDVWRHAPSQEFIHRKFSAFSAFVASTNVIGFCAPAASWGSHVVRYNGFALHIGHINTAWAAGYEGDDQQRLIVGSEQLADVLRDGAQAHAVLLIGHHPPETLHRADQRSFRHVMERDVDFYLCGHVHDPAAEGFVRRAGPCRIVAGASYVDRQFSHGYNVTTLSRCTATVSLRRYTARHNFYGADTLLYQEASESGVISWQWRHRPRVYIAGSGRHIADEHLPQIRNVVRALTTAFIEKGVGVWATSRVASVGSEVWATGLEWCRQNDVDPVGRLGDAGLYPLLDSTLIDSASARATYIGLQDLVVAIGGAEGTTLEIEAAHACGIPIVALPWYGGAAAHATEAPSLGAGEDLQSRVEIAAPPHELADVTRFAASLASTLVDWLWRRSPRKAVPW
jgi:3',5'-cyclic AMP phosphodiesterase CpdA